LEFMRLTKVCALIPAKGFLHAKQRLSPVLGVRERELLAEAMLRDVLGQVVAARGLEATFVVTGDDRVSEIATGSGARVIREKEERGETEAVRFALAEMKQRGIRAVLVLPADIPLVRTSDVGQLVESIRESDSASRLALLVPSHDHLGTNALLLSPPDVIQLRFGYDSFSYHLRQVAAEGLPARVIENERIALDIDEPRDLKRFLLAGERGSESHAKLMQMGLVGSFPDAQRTGSS